MNQIIETIEVKTIHAVYFSPAGATGKLTRTIAERLAVTLDCAVDTVDFTLPKDHHPVCFNERDLVVFGMPTYAGRLPNKIQPYIRELFQGNNAQAIAVVTYGNRAYDSSLAEIVRELQGSGFRPRAGAAFPCRHVFSEKLAPGRPDEGDLHLGACFAELLVDPSRDQTEPNIVLQDLPGDPVGPYYRPLGLDGQPAVFLKAKPKTDLTRCDACGICAVSCPMGAIDTADPTVVPGTCIKCQACIKKCPQKAKYFDDPAFLSHVAMLEKNYTARKEPVFFRISCS